MVLKVVTLQLTLQEKLWGNGARVEIYSCRNNFVSNKLSLWCRGEMALHRPSRGSMHDKVLLLHLVSSAIKRKLLLGRLDCKSHSSCKCHC